MRNVLLVATGGALGAVARYLIGVWLYKPEPIMPWGTLTANLIGCLLIGMGYHFVQLDQFTPSGQLVIMTGFIGAFTTFSTFSLETFLLLENGKFGVAISYVGLSIGAGLLLVWLGFWTMGKLTTV